MPSASKVLTLNDRMPFGKYSGKLVSSVIRENPDYMIWWAVNVERYPLEESAKDELDRELDYLDWN